MKLEILFRGKRVDNGEWVEGFYYCRDWENTHWIRVKKDFHFIDIKVIPETVGQFTGLCDKNGKKIFEGDLLVQRTSACSDLPGGVVIPDELYAYWKVLWDDRTNGFNSFPISSLSEADFNVAIEQLGGLIQWPSGEVLSNCWHYEVIGNIHDNPELLNE